MAENKVEKTEEKKKSGGAGCLIVLLILLLTPILSVGVLYFFNKDFSMSVNSVMSNVPGPVGSFFEKFPTKAEEQDQIRQISEYYLSIDEETAIDRLMLMESTDARAYDEVIKDMLRINPNKTKNILDGIRDIARSKDAIANAVSQIDEEKISTLQNMADYYTSLPVTAVIEDINAKIADSINGYKDVASIMEYIDDSVAEEIMYQLDAETMNRIFAELSDTKAMAIRNSHNDKTRRETDLEQIASVYASEDPDTLIQTIGNASQYTIEELAIIYKNLGAKKAGEVLAKSTDDTFVFQVVEKMKERELLENNQDNLTPDVLKSLKIYKEFDDNVGELVNVYSKMGTDKVAAIIKNMMINAAPSQTYDLNNGEIISISDEKVVLEILRSFNETKKAEILSLLDNTLSTELTRKLALPQN